MPRRCSVSGTSTKFGQNVSHSNRKSSRRFEPNLQKCTLPSEALGVGLTLRLSTRSLRTVRRSGGIDAFLLGTDDAKLPPEGLALKRRVLKALGSRSRPATSS
jgi:large subunit ribosomal protein L28